MHHDQPVFLLGFMGSGKSWLGSQVAQLSHRPFVDLDTALEQQEGCSIAALFRNGSEELFRAKERECLLSLPLHNHIVAVGGGTPCYADNMQWMNQRGFTIYLEVSTEELYRRLVSQTESRPLLRGLTGAALKRFIEDMLQVRNVFYRQAKFCLKADALTPAELLLYLPRR